MKLALYVTAALTALAIAAPAAAQSNGNVAIGLGVGSDGIGPDLLFKVTPNIVIGARAAGSVWTYHGEGTVLGAFPFKGNAHIDGISGHIDLHPVSTSPLFISPASWAATARCMPGAVMPVQASRRGPTPS